MIYQYITSIEPKFLWNYGIIGAFVVFFVTRIVRPTFAQVIALLIALTVVYFLNDKNEVQVASRNRELSYKLTALRPRPRYFHMDSDLIDYFWNIREFRNYNRDDYDGALKASDHILKLQSDAEKGLIYCEHTLDVAKDFMWKALNHMHAIIFKTPLDDSRTTYKKHDKAAKTLHLLLRRHIDDIYHLCQKTNGASKEGQKNGYKINTWTQIRQNWGPRPDDTQRDEYSSLYDFY
jgi:hypothetical protein